MTPQKGDYSQLILNVKSVWTGTSWQISTDKTKKGFRFTVLAGLLIIIGMVLMGLYFQEYQEITRRATTALKSVIQKAVGI